MDEGESVEQWDEISHMDFEPGKMGGCLETTSRLAVPGGWLYRTIWTIRDRDQVHASSVALAFVPDVLNDEVG